MLVKMWRKRNPQALVVGTQIGTVTMEKNMKFPQKIKNGIVIWTSNSTTVIPLFPKKM